jgi:16S rRNA G966 N2-methylase RsmD
MDRPIKSKGHYDMNFIDWNNEWENIVNSNYDNLDDNKQCPIFGMDIITFNELIK